MIRRIFLILSLPVIFLSIMASPVSADDAITVRVGIYENEPKYFTDDDGNPSGFWTDIVNYIASEEGWNLVFVPGTWEECLARLQSNEIDILPDVAESDERSQSMLFSDETVYVSWSSVYTKKDNRLQSILDLEGKTIAVLKDSINVDGPEGIRRILDSFSITCTFLDTNSYQEVFKLVRDGDAEAGVANKDFAAFNREEYDLVRSSIIFSPASLKFAFPPSSNTAGYLAGTIDRYLVELKADQDSLLYSSMEEWLGVVPETSGGIPFWLFWLIGGIGLAALLLFAGNSFLRSRISSRTRELALEIEKRNHVETHISNVNSVLMAIRNVNQLIVHEKDRQSLIEQTCRLLVENRGVYGAWITLFEASGEYLMAASSGIDDITDIMTCLDAKQYPPCLSSFIDREITSAFCSDIAADNPGVCKVQDSFSEHQGYISLLEYNGKRYGVLAVLIPEELTSDPEEKSLLDELSGDIAFALHNISESEEQTRIKDMVEGLARFPDENPNPVLRIGFDGRLLYANGGASVFLEHWGIEQGQTVIGECRDMIEQIMKEGTARIVEYRIGERVYSCNVVPISPAGYTNIYGADITERRQTEALLSESEEKYRLLIDNLVDAVLLATLDGMVESANPAACRMFGRTEEEIRQAGRFKLVDHADPRLADLWEMSSRTGGGKAEVNMFRKDGTIFPAEVALALFTDKDGQNKTSVVIRDITEQKKTEEELKLRAMLLDVASDGICLFTKEGEYTYLNEEYCTTHGYSREELLGMNIRQIDVTGSAEWYASVDRQLHEKGHAVFESSHHRKDGETIILEIHLTQIETGGKTYYLGIERDITEQKKATLALQESELFRSSLLDNAPNPINVINPDTSIRYVNPALERLTGYSSGELVGVKAPYPFWNDDFKRRTIKLVETMKTGLMASERQFTRKNGEQFWVRITSMPVMKDGELEYLLASWIDITESKAANDALQESEERYRNLVNSSPIGVYIAQNGRFLFANPEFQDMSGYSETELLTMASDEMIYPEDRDLVRNGSLDMLKGRRTEGFEFRAITSDGRIRWVMQTVTSINFLGKRAILGTSLDITERKRVEEELRQSEGKLSTIFDSLPQGLMVTDLNGTVVQVNRSAMVIYECEKEEDILGRNGLDFADEVYHQEIIDRIKESRDEGRITSSRYLAKTLKGNTFPAEMSVAPMVDSSGETFGIVGLFEDITEQQQMQENLMVTDRLASVGELAAGIAHELNNPLTGVIGYSDLLMLREDIPEEVKEDLTVINKEAFRASQIARHLLTFARKHPDEKQYVNINQIIDVVLELRAYEQRVNNIEVIQHLDQNLPSVKANDYQLQQVFINIIINAEHFMIENNGRGVLEITTEHDGGVVRVTIADDGPGIPADYLNRIFDPFYTTKEVGKGTGLGLSICYGIITEHGGKIWAESEMNKGAAFIIELPVPEE